MTGLRILRAGPLCTLQDGGRNGWLRYGITPAGPMDWIAHATANLLAGNAASAAALEIGPAGIEVTAESGNLRLGVAAPGFVVRLGTRSLPARMALTLPQGERLSIQPGPWGLWAYLTVSGGFAVRPVMGSLSTHVRSEIGPFQGRPMQSGQILDAMVPMEDKVETLAVMDGAKPPNSRVRFVLGPQDDHFTPAALSDFCTAPYRVSPQCDRMGYRMIGPALTHARGHDIVSDGIALGSIQVPGDGQPIVLMADRQPTGGYPKIGTVIRADLPHLAQTRPGQNVRFEAVSIDAAVTALRDATPAMATLQRHLRQIRLL